MHACVAECRNAATLVMLDSKQQPIPVKPHLSMRESNDQVSLGKFTYGFNKRTFISQSNA